jgi:hypothetical protein
MWEVHMLAWRNGLFVWGTQGALVGAVNETLRWTRAVLPPKAKVKVGVVVPKPKLPELSKRAASVPFDRNLVTNEEELSMVKALVESL